MSVRLTLALDAGLTLPNAGRIAVFGALADSDLSPLPQDRLHVVQPFRPGFDHHRAAGLACDPAPEGPYSAAIVILPRAKALAHAWLHMACALTDGPVLVDGLKTTGVDSVLRDLRKRLPEGEALGGPVSKAHGKAFWFTAAPDLLLDWKPVMRRIADRYVTGPGAFSADGIDPASELLCAALPARIGADIADLGAGWGYLSARMLEREDIRSVHLVEADHDALDCARQNVADERATFHWADARHWTPPAPLDAVVMNPPFHTGRSADPELGRGFIVAAARALKPSGKLWMVANRHLPYEAALDAAFGKVEELSGDARFKLFCAERPIRQRR